MMSLNLRSLQIIEALLNATDYLKISQLAEKMQTSERNIRYSLKKTEEFLNDHHFQVLIRHHRKGVLLKKTPELIAFLADFMQRTTPYQYNYSKEELSNFILLKLLIESRPVSIAYFEDHLYVSRTTILNHLKKIDSNLYLQGMELKNTPRSGYQIIGNEINKTTIFANVFIQNLSIREFYNFIETETNTSKVGELFLFHLFEIESLQLVMKLVHRLEQKLKMVFDDRSCLILIVFLLKWLNGTHFSLSKQTMMEIDQNEAKAIKETIEQSVGKVYVTDQVLIQLIELIHSLRNLHTERTIDAPLQQIVQQLCVDMSKRFNVDFLNDSHLISSLSSHIDAMIQRISKGMNLENPLFDQFTQEHANIFEATKQASQSLETLLSLPFDDHEISFLAIYFAASLQKIEAQKMRKPKILVVCAEGVAISKMLAITIKKLFDIESVKPIAVRSLTQELIRFYDFVISTVDIPDIDSHKLIKIDRLLGAKEIELLKERFSLNLATERRNNVNKLNQIMEVINETCQIHDLHRLQFAMLKILVSETEPDPMYQKLPFDVTFNETLVQAHAHAEDWQDAIRLGTRSLLEQGYIESRYHKKIIENLQTIGPYMVVAPGVILSHAGPDDGVRTNAFSIVTLDQGVDFGDPLNTPVQLIWTLALKETKNELLIEKIMEVILDQHTVSQLLSTDSANKIYTIIQQQIF
ncbi:transcriptional antiterminator, BglG family [Seinonella peptonophila]|uniref:Transcriptional antiterminator, BglG family n=1 Tax=Seinonella peptonophila TaxID=112248 RepID=A0A1M5A7T7_9BACL|nr:BglG family transcription antiterminator [Seinonella peptonophila]SHF26333.1 transcriptional antiterminator, BglG family [Seinonella peptonophila]